MGAWPGTTHCRYLALRRLTWERADARQGPCAGRIGEGNPSRMVDFAKTAGRSDAEAMAINDEPRDLSASLFSFVIINRQV